MHKYCNISCKTFYYGCRLKRMTLSCVIILQGTVIYNAVFAFVISQFFFLNQHASIQVSLNHGPLYNSGHIA